MLDFVALMECITVHEAALRVDDWFQLGLATKRQSSPPSLSKPTETSEAPRLQATRKKAQRRGKGKSDGESSDVAPTAIACNSPLGFALKNLDAEHPYIHERGISEEAVAEFGIGYCLFRRERRRVDGLRFLEPFVWCSRTRISMWRSDSTGIRDSILSRSPAPVTGDGWCRFDRDRRLRAGMCSRV